MKYTFILSLLSATLAMAAPPKGLLPIDKLEPISEGACIPASCASFGCCSGNCGYWCRACGIDYGC